MRINVKKTMENAVLPKYAHDSDACFDLVAATVSGSSTAGAFVTGRIQCDTGLSFEIPDGWAMLVFSRSGHGFKHAVRLANVVGVIDAGYRDTVKVKLTCDDHDGDLSPLHIQPGDRIAQAMLVPIEKIQFDLVEELSDSDRGMNGLGSTGN